MKRGIPIFTIDLQGNYPAIMVDPPVEYLKMCDFPQIPPFPLQLYSCMHMSIDPMMIQSFALRSLNVGVNYLFVIQSVCNTKDMNDIFIN